MLVHRMKTRSNFVAACVLLLASFAGAQAPGTPATTVPLDKVAQSQEVQLNMRKVDILLHLMPLALKKDQYETLLSELEKVRAKQRLVLETEDDEVIKLGAELETAVKDAIEKGSYPKRELQVRCFKTTRALGIVRQLARGEMADTLYDVVNKIFDAGQKKIAANSIDWKLLDPTSDLDTKDEPTKIRAYIKAVLMDPLAYDLMILLAKKAN